MWASFGGSTSQLPRPPGKRSLWLQYPSRGSTLHLATWRAAHLSGRIGLALPGMESLLLFTYSQAQLYRQ
jgi:hypothetical protein